MRCDILLCQMFLSAEIEYMIYGKCIYAKPSIPVLEDHPSYKVGSSPLLRGLMNHKVINHLPCGMILQVPQLAVSFWDEMLVKGSAFGGCGADLPSSCFWPIPGIWTAPSLGPRSCKTEKANKKWENTKFEKLDQIRETWSFSVIYCGSVKAWFCQ